MSGVVRPRPSGQRHDAGQPINASTGKTVLRFFVVVVRCGTTERAAWLHHPSPDTRHEPPAHPFCIVAMPGSSASSTWSSVMTRQLTDAAMTGGCHGGQCHTMLYRNVCSTIVAHPCHVEPLSCLDCFRQ